MDIHGNPEDRDVFGNSMNRDVFGNQSNNDIFGNPPRDVFGNYSPDTPTPSGMDGSGGGEGLLDSVGDAIGGLFGFFLGG